MTKLEPVNPPIPAATETIIVPPLRTADPHNISNVQIMVVVSAGEIPPIKVEIGGDRSSIFSRFGEAVKRAFESFWGGQ
jgi:hypothetical protein